MSKAIDLENGLPAIKTWVESKIPSPADTAPVADGTAAVGTSADYAREDHRHPTDTSRAPNNHASTATTYGAGTSSKYGHVKLSDATNGTAAAASGGTAATPKAVADALAAATGAIPAATTTTPKMDGTAAVGSETKWAKGDHVHPTDTSRAPLASPALTGTPTAPTAAAGTNTTQIATTAFVKTAVDNVTVADFTPPTTSAAGTHGLVPAPPKSGMAKILTASGFKTLMPVTDAGQTGIGYVGFPNGDNTDDRYWLQINTANGSDKGVVAVSDSITSTTAASSGTAASPKAVKDAKEAAIAAIPAASSTTPSMDGTAAIGTGTTWARADHVHPTDTSRAPTSHASSATTYGTGTSSNYGHLKLSDSTSSTSGTSGGIAATPKAVADALTAAKSYADGKVTGLYSYKGSVETYANLPASPSTGDVYNVEAAYGDYPAGTNWAWTGTAWDALGGSFTITFATAAEVTAVLNGTA